MGYLLEASCGCNTGKIRKNNEDNFFFDGICLEAENAGLKYPVTMTKSRCREMCVAIFDGMVGENFGEQASYAAARAMQTSTRSLKDYFIPKRQFLEKLCLELNEAVVSKAKELCTEYMGSTMVSLCFSHRYVYVCNLGDSRAYRLRDGEFLQLSEDHVEKRGDSTKKKMPLTQHLGIDPQNFLIEPYIAKEKLKHGDQYLLCSDGLTDMLTNLEIDEILCEQISSGDKIQQLIDKAMEKGGKDNITAIVVHVL